MPFVFVAPVGVDRLLAGVFLMLAVLGPLCTLGERNAALTGAAVVHGVAGVGSIVAGDLITLLVCWEFLTFSAFVVIRSAQPAGLRWQHGLSRRAPLADTPVDASFWYVGAQIVAAVLFFVAAVIHYRYTGSLVVEALHPAAQVPIVLAVLVKTAMMPLHGWLVSSYSRATPAGSIVLSVFTTKVGVLTAVRLVSWNPSGVPILTYIGATVAVVAVVFAFLQVNARRLLAFHIVSQVGYMLVGAGLAQGDAGSIGATAGLFHAANHIVYKALLFLVVALVANRTGHEDLRRLGGLWRRMPVVFACAIVGSGAIAGAPFLSGYASKELLKVAAGYTIPTYLLMIASVGTGLSFIKFCYLIFVRRPDASDARSRGGVDAGRVGSSPHNPWQLGTAVVLALLSVVLGVFPGVASGVAHRYFSGQSLAMGVAPLFASAFLWVALRRWLVAGVVGAGSKVASDRTRGGRLRRWLKRVSGPVLEPLHALHRLNPQVYLGLVMVVAVALIALLG